MIIRLSIFYLGLLLCHSGLAQTIERNVISSGAMNETNSAYFSSTIGQPAFTTASTSGQHFTQGFEQPGNIGLQVDYAITFEECFDGSNVQVSILSIGGCEFESYQVFWDGEPGSDILSNSDDGNVVLDIVTDSGCEFSEQIFIDVPDDLAICEFEVFNGMSPNGDGLNEFLYVRGALRPEYAQNKVLIFNRWGQEIWSTEDYNNQERKWEGLDFNGKPVPDGTYYYVFRTEQEEFSGFITLSR